jgi:murein DD-endopeptidase MepM/ murein hydrolase activator NlpD
MFQPILNNFQAKADYNPVDLSKSTLNKLNINPQDHNELTKYLDQIRKQQQAKILYGGYLEKRSLYNKKSHFNTDNKQRNIHLGVDFWANAREEIITPLDGLVHSFANNTGFGNYGPCIILKHSTEDKRFYTLYGHLSLDSLENLEPGQLIKTGNPFSRLGDVNENGGYVPHLHFQIITDIQNFKGDYPGVCHKEDLEFYEKNTISPIAFLGL